MKKEDLKNGNIIELRDGRRAIKTNIKGFEYIRLDYISATSTALFSLNEFNDDLKGSHSGLDIMKVYEDYTCQKVLWERKEKPKLTEDEKAILRNLPKKWKYIVRDEDSCLWIFNDYKPHKGNTTPEWLGSIGKSFILFQHLFQFIKWEDEEPYLISDLLEEEN